MDSSVQGLQPHCKIISSRVSALSPVARAATVSRRGEQGPVPNTARQQDAVAALSGQIEDLEGEVAP
jgi:hypothetical protein